MTPHAENCKLVFHYIQYVNQPDTQRFTIEFIHITWWLDMFRTSMVRPQERLQAVCCGFAYVVGSKRFRPDQLFKATEIKQICYFST